IPGKGAINARVESELGSPVEHGAGAFGTKELMTNFIARLIEHFRAKRGLHLPQDQSNQIEHADLAFIGKIKSLAPEAGIRGEALGEQHVCGYAIFDVEIVADEVTVGSHHGPLPANKGANRARHHAIPVQIASTIEISATRNCNRQVVADGIGLGDQIGARLADVVRMTALQRHRLCIGKMLLVAVGLIGGRDDNRRDLWRTAASLKQIPGALDIGGEGRYRVAIGDADDGLGRQMEDNFDFVLAQGALDQVTVDNIAAYGIDLLNTSAAHEFALRNPVPSQATHT